MSDPIPRRILMARLLEIASRMDGRRLHAPGYRHFSDCWRIHEACALRLAHDLLAQDALAGDNAGLLQATEHLGQTIQALYRAGKAPGSPDLAPEFGSGTGRQAPGPPLSSRGSNAAGEDGRSRRARGRTAPPDHAK